MVSLTSRDRVLAALRGQEPDRVPFMEVSVDRAVAYAAVGQSVTNGRAPRTRSAAEDLIAMGGLFGMPEEGDLELARAMGLDALGVHFWVPTERVNAEVDGHSMMVGGKIKSRSDLALLRLRLPDPDNPMIYEPYQRFIERYRDSGLALFCFTSMGFDSAVQGMGFETFSYALYDDPILVEGMFDLYADWYTRAMRRLTALGFDFLWLGDDIAFKTAPFVSPRVFRSLFLPRGRRVVEQITLPWVFHSDGNLVPILDDLLELGMCGLHPIEPEAMDLVEIKRRYGSRVCLLGNISVDTLSRGTPKEVDALVEHAIQVAAPEGGYIVGSSNSITWYCKPENVAAMCRAAQRYGAYPIGARSGPAATDSVGG